MIITSLIAVMAVSGIAAYAERKRLVKLIDAAEIKVIAAEAKAIADVKAAEAGIKAPADIRASIEKVLNDIRVDESILQMHVYALILRIRNELRKI